MKKLKTTIQMNKKEICVPIRDEEELQQAKDMLEKNGEKVDENLFILKKRAKSWNCLRLSNNHFWFLGTNYNLTEIPLSELESVLKGEEKPHSFCEKPEEKCTMNYCDENGCQNRKRVLVSDAPVLNGESDGTNAYFSFFKFMSDEHNLTLTDTEMSDIIHEAKKVIEKLKND